MTLRFIVLLCLLLVPSPMLTRSADPVGRGSDDATDDLIDALLAAGRFDDARSLASPEWFDGDEAKAAIASCEIDVAFQMTQPVFDEAAGKPVEDFLSSHPDHERKLFLQAQARQVRLAAVRHAVSAAAVSPLSPAKIESLSKRLVAVTTEASDFAGVVADQRIAIDSSNGRDREGLVSDLHRLEHQSLIDAVSMSLLQTELLDESKASDRIAAASAVIELAQRTLTRLPAGSLAANEIERLRIEAMLIARQTGPAAEAFDALSKRIDGPWTDGMVSLRVRIAMAAGQSSLARERLDAVYGSAALPRTIDLDLTRLRYLVQSHSSDVASWIEQIAAKHGAYARQRAEAVMLSIINAEGRSQAVDAAIVAAQGRDRLRRGDVVRAAELLTAAADAQRDPERAIGHAIEAAAAYRESGNTLAAANVLRQTALKHVEADRAAAVHLQSLVMSPGDTKTQSHLETHLQTWPDADTTQAATDWLVKLRLAAEDAIGAASAMTRTLKPEQTERIGHATNLWLAAFSQTEFDGLPDLSSRFVEACQRLPSAKLLDTFRRDTAALVCDANALNELPKSVFNAGSESEASKYLADAFAMRRDRNIRPVASPESLPPIQTETLRRRLMADGHRDRELRIAIARWIDAWPDDGPADQKAMRQVWTGNVTGAVSTLETFVAQDTASADRMRVAAELLASSDDPSAVFAAIDFYDRLAAGMPQGSQDWHDAKLASIRLLRQTGRIDDADKRARYVLLTADGLSDELRKRYDAFIKP